MRLTDHKSSEPFSHQPEILSFLTLTPPKLWVQSQKCKHFLTWFSSFHNFEDILTDPYKFWCYTLAISKSESKCIHFFF